MAMNKPQRTSTREVELFVLDRSRRRCALCFGINGDLREKYGQIAHLDQDRSNNGEDNLAFLCLEHHSLYDTVSSQHKGYRLEETKIHRNRLYDLITQDGHLPGSALSPDSRNTDRQTLSKLMDRLPNNGSIAFIRTFDFDNRYQYNSLSDFHYFVEDTNGPEHEFLDPDLEKLRQTLRIAIGTFLRQVASNTFVCEHPPSETFENSWHQIDREFALRDPKAYRSAIDFMNTAADELIEAYDVLIRAARRNLYS